MFIFLLFAKQSAGVQEQPHEMRMVRNKVESIMCAFCECVSGKGMVQPQFAMMPAKPTNRKFANQLNANGFQYHSSTQTPGGKCKQCNAHIIKSNIVSEVPNRNCCIRRRPSTRIRLARCRYVHGLEGISTRKTHRLVTA